MSTFASQFDSKTLHNQLHELSQLRTEWDKFGCNPTCQIEWGAGSAHKKGQMPLNVGPTSACNFGLLFLVSFGLPFSLSEICERGLVWQRWLQGEWQLLRGQCFFKWYDNPRYLLFFSSSILLHILTFTTFFSFFVFSNKMLSFGSSLEWNDIDFQGMWRQEADGTESTSWWFQTG